MKIMILLIQSCWIQLKLITFTYKFTLNIKPVLSHSSQPIDHVPKGRTDFVLWHKTSRSARSLVFFQLLARSHIPQDIVLMSLTAHGTRTSPQVASCRERDDIVIYCNPLVGVVLEAATHYRPAEATNYYWAVWCLLARSEESGVVNVAL